MIPPCYVITLNKTLGEQGEALKKAGLDPILFEGVNGNKYEHVYYDSMFHGFFKHIMFNGAKGCSLSHQLLCEKLYNDEVEVALILEDDAYPFENIELNQEIEKVLGEVPEDWDIIRLHCDSWCKNNSNTVKNNDTSTAAYLISRRGITKCKNSTIKFSVDNQQNNEMIVYKSKNNLFFTDEKVSTLRGSNESYIFEPFLNFLIPIKNGEKTWNTKLNHKLLKLGNSEVRTVDLITFIFVVVGLIIFYYINK